jgi:hypothetical protein
MLVENDRTLLTMLANSLAQFGQNITAIASNPSDAIKLFLAYDFSQRFPGKYDFFELGPPAACIPMEVWVVIEFGA